MAGDNKLTYDPPTRLPELTQQVVPWSLHTFPENFMQNRSSRFLVTLLKKK